MKSFPGRSGGVCRAVLGRQPEGQRNQAAQQHAQQFASEGEGHGLGSSKNQGGARTVPEGE